MTMVPKTLVAGVGLALAAGVVALFGLPELTRAPSPRIGADAANAQAGIISVEITPSDVDYRRLDARIAELMQAPDMVGLGVGIIEKGQVRFLKGYGETVVGSGQAVTPDTVFRWASLSKGVAAALVVGLAEDGKLSLDTPVDRLGTTLTLPGGTRGVTVADVLSHRVGLRRNAWDDRLEAGEDPRVLRAELGRLDPYCPPATCYGYQNIAFDTATEIVERVSGTRYAALAERQLFAPLGMRSATIGRAGLEASAAWARPHSRSRVPTTVTDVYYRVPAAGGVNSSVRDLLVWMDAQMGSAPNTLSPSALATMQTPLVRTPPRGRRGPMDRAFSNASYGLGWRTMTYAGRTLVGHRGWVDGYGSLILFDPVDRSGIVMLWNSNTGRPGRLQLEFFDMLYGLPFTDWLELPVEGSQPNAPKVAEGGAQVETNSEG
jgi:beta-lactamase class C